MPEQNVARLHQWLADHEQPMLEDLRTLLRIPSIETEPVPNGPFGAANRDALDFMLGLGERWGMRTKDIEGFAGYAEFGSGDRLVMSLGHLDVVPVGPGWKYEPFGAEIDEGYLYARGAVDDKGPTMASFYAARAISGCFPDIGCRIRSVFGCDEESGFECIHRYTQTEEAPTFGIAPDSGWPLYHAEKGIANLVVERPLIEGEMALVEVCGGQRPNIVIDSCRAVVRVSPSARGHVEAKLAEAWDRNVTFSYNGDLLTSEAVGKAAHGSEPFRGDSAAIRALRFLEEIAPLSVAKAYEELRELTHIAGEGLGISGSDEVSRGLTCNLGIVETTDGMLRMTFNVRYPVTWKGDAVRDRALAALSSKEGGYRLAEFSDSPSLYFPLDHVLVETICDVYAAETGEQRAPGVMGGGTYARAIANTVSVGTGWEGDGKAHETDERLKVEHLYKMSRIYAHILYRLATV